MTKILICYRRELETDAGLAGYFRSRLEKEFAGRLLEDEVPPGSTFSKYYDGKIRPGCVMLVIMGPGWAAPLDANDPVRIQIETALKRDILVIPVLADDVAMPEASALPEPLRGLTARRSARRRDLARTVEVIRAALHEPTLTDKWLGQPPFLRLIVYACFGTLIWAIFQTGSDDWDRAVYGTLYLAFAFLLAGYSARTGFKDWVELLLSLVLVYAGAAAVSELMNRGLGWYLGKEPYFEPSDAALWAEIFFAVLLLGFMAARWRMRRAAEEAAAIEAEEDEALPEHEWRMRWLQW
jgi:hypothetical protein